MTKPYLDSDQRALLDYVQDQVLSFDDGDDLKAEYEQAAEKLRHLYSLGFTPASAEDYTVFKRRVDQENDAYAAMCIVSRRRMSIDFEETWGYVTIKFWEDDMEWIEVDLTEHNSAQDNLAAVLFGVSLAIEAWLDRQVWRLMLCDSPDAAESKWLDTND